MLMNGDSTDETPDEKQCLTPREPDQKDGRKDEQKDDQNAGPPVSAWDIEASWSRWNWPPNTKVDKYDPCNQFRCGFCYKKRIGNYFVHGQCGDSTNPVLCISSPSSWFSCFVTVPLIISIPSLALYLYFGVFTGDPNKFFWIPIIVISGFTLSLITYMLIRFSDPGILPVPTNSEWRENNPRDHFEHLNGQTNPVPMAYKMESQHYTFVAGHGVYVHDFDHFCPWVGNLVGGKNMCVFSAFVGTACTSLFVIGGLVLFMMGYGATTG